MPRPPRLTVLLRCAEDISPAVDQVMRVTVSLENFRDPINAVSLSHSSEIKDGGAVDRECPPAELPLRQHKLRDGGTRMHAICRVVSRLLQQSADGGGVESVRESTQSVGTCEECREFFRYLIFTGCRRPKCASFGIIQKT